MQASEEVQIEIPSFGVSFKHFDIVYILYMDACINLNRSGLVSSLQIVVDL